MSIENIPSIDSNVMIEQQFHKESSKLEELRMQKEENNVSAFIILPNCVNIHILQMAKTSSDTGACQEGSGQLREPRDHQEPAEVQQVQHPMPKTSTGEAMNQDTVQLENFLAVWASQKSILVFESNCMLLKLLFYCL